MALGFMIAVLAVLAVAETALIGGSWGLTGAILLAVVAVMVGGFLWAGSRRLRAKTK